MKKLNLFEKQASDSFLTAVFLTLSGGFQDAYTYSCRGEVFANAQTGNIVLLSLALFKRRWDIAIKYLVPILSFIAGIATSTSVQIHLKNYGKLHWRQIVLIMEIILLFAVGFIPSDLQFLANALVSFVCAMQVQAFYKIEGNSYASTMCIGNLRSGTQAFCEYVSSKDKMVLKKAITYFSVIFIFAVGAGIGGVLTSYIGYKSIWISCLLLTISTGLMFFDSKGTDF